MLVLTLEACFPGFLSPAKLYRGQGCYSGAGLKSHWCWEWRFRDWELPFPAAEPPCPELGLRCQESASRRRGLDSYFQENSSGPAWRFGRQFLRGRLRSELLSKWPRVGQDIKQLLSRSYNLRT